MALRCLRGRGRRVTGPYRHITWLKGAGCDTTLFADDNGKTYAIMPFGDEFIQEVNLTGIEQGDIKLVGSRRMIVSRDNKDVGRRTSPDYLEGPWIIKRKGKYILFTAAPYRKPKLVPQTSAPADLAEGYWVGAAVADNIWGPIKSNRRFSWEDTSPSSKARTAMNGSPIVGCGRQVAGAIVPRPNPVY